MVLRRRGVLVAVALSIGIAFFGTMQAGGKQTEHQQPRYDNGGTFRITLDVPTAERVKAREQIHGFIWYHWSQHRRGKVGMIGQSIEGQATVQEIFIGPDARGRWCIRDQEAVDVHKGAHPSNRKPRLDLYDEVQRIEIDSEQAIPPSRKRRAGTYRLLLINTSTGAQWVF